MNALPFPLPPVSNDDAAYAASLAMLTDRRLGEALELLADWIELHFLPGRERDANQMRKIQAAMVAVSHAREMVGPLTVERA